MCLNRFAVWIDTCHTTLYTLQCGPEVKEAIKTLVTAINNNHVGCTTEDIEKLQPLVQHYKALVEEKQRLKANNSK